MKRDMELIRKVMLKLEGHEEALWSGEFAIEDYAPEQVKYHLLLLLEGGLIEGADASSVSGIDVIPFRLSWKGHEFLDDARNDTVWKRFMATVQEKGGSVSLAVAQALLIATAKQQWGLP